ncbi:MAG: cysteine dioxygenase family protein [Candidatus Eremiobacteraeota bacterium]|nr:cysteine dioxygenase family protein [Candidatus Eremiobacteraeota bacterium]
MLRQLINDFRARGPLERGAAEVGTLLARESRDWAKRGLVFRPGDYTRTCVYRNASFEVLLLNWATGAASQIHDHGDQHCWMLVLDGRLDVEDYVRLDPGDVPGYAHVEPCGRQRLSRGDTDVRSGPFDLHRVAATAGAPAVSLHVYSGPLRNYIVYDEPGRRCEVAHGKYDDVFSVYSEPVLR